MSLTDQTLYCRDCGQEFVFTVGEQEFYASRGLTNSPSRCPSCRAARKGQGGGYGGGRNSGGGGYSDPRPPQKDNLTWFRFCNQGQKPFPPPRGQTAYFINCYQDQGS